MHDFPPAPISALVTQQSTPPHPKNMYWFFSMYFYCFKEASMHQSLLQNPNQSVPSHDQWDVASLVWQVCHFKDAKILPCLLQQQNTKLIPFQGKHKVDLLSLLQITASLASYQAVYSLRAAFVLSVHLWRFWKQWNAVLDGTDITGCLLAAQVFSLLQWVLFNSSCVPHLFVCRVTSTLCH